MWCDRIRPWQGRRIRLSDRRWRYASWICNHPYPKKSPTNCALSNNRCRWPCRNRLTWHRGWLFHSCRRHRRKCPIWIQSKSLQMDSENVWLGMAATHLYRTNLGLVAMETAIGPLCMANSIAVSFLANEEYRDSFPATGVTSLIKLHVPTCLVCEFILTSLKKKKMLSRNQLFIYRCSVRIRGIARLSTCNSKNHEIKNAFK